MPETSGEYINPLGIRNLVSETREADSYFFGRIPYLKRGENFGKAIGVELDLSKLKFRKGYINLL